MKKLISVLTLIVFFLLSNQSMANKRQITITIDDLPFVGSTHNKPGNLRREQQRFLNILNALVDHGVPATGFVIGGTIEKDQWQLLQQFHDEGFVIANHTHTHKNLNTTSAERYISDIEKTDKRLQPLMNGKKFFRYPYLAEGRGAKKATVIEYLKSKNYIIAPVTVDPKDFRYNSQLLSIYWRDRAKRVGSVRNRYLSYMWRQTQRAERITEKKYGKPMPQILLIHANLLNSFVMGDIIEMYKSKGYQFIGLEEALEAYDKTKKGSSSKDIAEKS